MTATLLSADDVARFLQDNPDFFTDHASLFADLRVPHPHQAKAISLGERQILTLRARARDLEWQLSGLIQNATGNERISRQLIAWCQTLLSENDPQQLPDLIVDGLARLFALPDVALRLWNLRDLDAGHPCAQPVSPGVLDKIQEHPKPWCGPADNPDVSAWLPSPPASMALLPLTAGTPAQTIGILVLGSPDATRFTTDMGTEFLETIASLAGAGLSRLGAPGAAHSA